MRTIERTTQFKRGDKVLRDASELTKQRTRKITALDVAIARGLAELEAGHVKDAKQVFAELDDRYAAMATDPAL